MLSYVLPVDKPAGPTSHDIVAKARRALGTKRIGHTGTLDPFASGLLLLCVNHATRVAEYLTDLGKTYHAVARFDGATTTDDCTGDFITTSDEWQTTTESDVRAAFESQRGTILQMPSKFSAKKIAGERAYHIARRGGDVELSPSEVTIYDIRILEVQLPEVTFEVDCSSGTYIRAIARDVGAAIGTGGYLRELRRTGIGRFNVTNAVTVDGMADEEEVRRHRVGVLDAIADMARVNIGADEERALRFGQSIVAAAPAGQVAVARDGELIAIASSDGERIKPKKVFASE
jgi:tRNA pseudouridine55 synthase